MEVNDPYEIPKNEWEDNVDSWPDITYIHVGMYLLFSESAYTKEQLMNYKSLDSYQNFANGWVREVVCKKFGENRLLIAKVNQILSRLFSVVLCKSSFWSPFYFCYKFLSRCILFLG